MREPVAVLAAMFLATPLAAQLPEGSAPPVEAAADSQVIALSQENNILRQQLEAAQAEAQRLRTDSEAHKATVDWCHAKNGRLVEIGNELIAAYQKRYRIGSFWPFQFPRARFESEMQAIGDRVYENRVDVPPPAPPPTADPSAAPQNGSETDTNGN